MYSLSLSYKKKIFMLINYDFRKFIIKILIINFHFNDVYKFRKFMSNLLIIFDNIIYL